MGRAAKTYIWTVIAIGGLALTSALASFTSASPWSWAIYIALVVLASAIPLRLPGMEGRFPLNFLFLLYGIAHFSFAETLIAGCAGALTEYLANAKERPGAIQALFNAASVAVSVGACFLIGRVWLAEGMARHLPAAMALAACAWFVINTILVSGIPSLLGNKPLEDVYAQSYVWSFPYYLIGVTLTGLAPAPGQSVPGEGWLVLLPVVYLVYFFLRLADAQASSAPGNRANAPLPRAARMYLAVVVTAGLHPLIAAGLDWQSQDAPRFVVYLALAVVASTFKIQLPRVGGTISPAFVLLLASITQLSCSETTVMAAVVGLVQLVWRPARSPMLAQILFNPACMALSAAFAWVLSRVLLEPSLGHSVVGVLLVSTLALYGSNTVIVTGMLALLNRRPLSRVWKLCNFWSLPYYLVGAAVAGIMTATSHTADWPASLLVLPLMGLVYFSYRMQLREAVARSVQVPA